MPDVCTPACLRSVGSLLRSAGVALAVVVSLSACSDVADRTATATSAPTMAPTSAPETNVTASTVASPGTASAGTAVSSSPPPGTGTVVPSSTVPMSTLAPGEPIVVQPKIVHVDDLSPSCAQAVAAIRALMEKNPSSYAISAADAAAFNAALAAPNQLVDGVPACTADEFARFNANELQPWLSLPKA